MLGPRGFAIVSVVLLAAGSAFAAAGPMSAVKQPVVVYGKYETFTWTEYGASDEKLLQEKGPLYGVGLIARSERLRAKIELFGGVVDYDGQTMEGDPLQTDTTYFGWKGEGDFLFIPRSGRSWLSPFVGLGLRQWWRDLKSTDDALGYTETWLSFYGHVGLDAQRQLGSDLALFGQARVGYSLFNFEYVDLLGDQITLYPGLGPQALFEGGLQWKRLRASVYTEMLQFAESDVTSDGFFQPKSKAVMVGFTLGLCF